MQPVHATILTGSSFCRHGRDVLSRQDIVDIIIILSIETFLPNDSNKEI
jgi:hypothetical protein